MKEATNIIKNINLMIMNLKRILIKHMKMMSLERLLMILICLMKNLLVILL